jgi:hypothetical protein
VLLHQAGQLLCVLLLCAAAVAAAGLLLAVHQLLQQFQLQSWFAVQLLHCWQL